jgi:hypothetical protein
LPTKTNPALDESLYHLAEFEDDAGWEEINRKPSPRNPAQQKRRVFVKQKAVGAEVHVLCWSEGRKEKDRAIREKHEIRLQVRRAPRAIGSPATSTAQPQRETQGSMARRGRRPLYRLKRNLRTCLCLPLLRRLC